MKRITRSSVALFAVLLLAGSAGAQGTTNRTAAQNQIVANEKAVMDAVGKNDPKTFHSYVASDGVSLNESGPMKNADIDRMMAGCKVARWGFSGSTFYWINDSSVVHIYKWTGKGTCEGQPIPEATWSSTVWTNKGGKWIGAFHQESNAMSPPTVPVKK